MNTYQKNNQIDLTKLLSENDSLSKGTMDIINKVQELESLDPQLSRAIQKNIFDIGANSIIGDREWALLTFAMLIAMGDAGDQLEVYLSVAVKSGATDDEILDVINIASMYTGAPRAVNAVSRIYSYLVAERKKYRPDTAETIIKLGDHETMVWDNHGEGTPILLMHCLSLDHRMWRKVYPQLSAGGRVIAYDLRGHGRARMAPKTKNLELNF